MTTTVTDVPSNESQPEPSAEEPASDERPLRIRYRIRFAKTDLLRWISHRDLARLWERLLRRARLKLSMTEGFHPKPRVGFPSALALGVEGLEEVVEIELAEDLSDDQFLSRLREDQQPGLEIKSVQRVPEGFPKARLLRSDYVISVIDTAELDHVQSAIDDLLAKTEVSVLRKEKTLTVSVAEQIGSLKLADRNLLLSLAASQSASLRPNDVLDLLGFDDWIEQGSSIVRSGVVLERDLEDSASECDEQKNTPIHLRDDPAAGQT